MKKILIVDDEQRVRELYVRALGEEGYSVRDAADARKAFNIITREEVDLVLLDIKLPEIDGKAMMDVIREFDFNLKVIVTSVYPIEKQKQMIPDAKSYYDKSQGLSCLLEKINEVLAEKTADN